MVKKQFSIVGFGLTTIMLAAQIVGPVLTVNFP